MRMLLFFLAADIASTQSIILDPDRFEEVEAELEEAIKKGMEKKQKKDDSPPDILAHHHHTISLANVWQKLEELLLHLLGRNDKKSSQLYPKKPKTVHAALKRPPQCRGRTIKIKRGGYGGSVISGEGQNVLRFEDLEKQRQPTPIACQSCGETDVYRNTRTPPDPTTR